MAFMSDNDWKGRVIGEGLKTMQGRGVDLGQEPASRDPTGSIHLCEARTYFGTL